MWEGSACYRVLEKKTWLIFVNWWLLAPTNSTPVGIPNFEFWEEGNFIQCKTAQLWYSYDTLGPGYSLARQLCSAPCLSALCCTGLLCWALVCSTLCQSALACTGLLHSALVRHLWCFSSARETQSLVFCRKVHSQSNRGTGLYRQKFLPLVPRWSSLMQMRTPNLCSLIGPKSTVLIGQNRAALIGHSCTAPNKWGKPQSHWFK